MNKLLTGLSLAMTTLAAQANPQTVDIMVLYTKDAQALPNGRDIDARIASYIEYTNNAYAKSGTNLRLRLVHKQLLDWATYYDVTGNNLNRFTNDAQVQRLREQYGADVVQLINRTTQGQGYGVCGIAWVGTGAKNSDQFYSNAKDMAYGLTGVDCGLSTFAHEIGHNMGLRHSYEQDLQDGYYQNHSGTHEWSRGYGVQGQFSTIMAYPQVFGARRQAPLFSNPRLIDSDCASQACGQHDHADASRALNSMAMQIANFRPTKVPVSAPPTSPKPELPWCSKPTLSGLVSNGEFRTADGWTAMFGRANLSLVNITANCRDNALLLTTQGFDALATTVSGLRGGVQYRLKARVKLQASNSRDNVRLAIVNEDTEGRLDFTPGGVSTLSVTGNEFSLLETSFTYKPSSKALRNQYVTIWSDSGSSLMADEVQLAEVVAKPPVTPPPPAKFGWNFENGTAGWAGFHGSSRVSTFASGSRKAMEVHNRKQDGAGAVASLLGNITPGQRYRFSTDITISRSKTVSATAYAYLYLVDSKGRAQQIALDQKKTRGGSWTKLQKDIQIPAGTFNRIDLRIVGSHKAQSLFIDNVSLSKL